MNKYTVYIVLNDGFTGVVNVIATNIERAKKITLTSNDVFSVQGAEYAGKVK
jgi:hypothetical protein